MSQNGAGKISGNPARSAMRAHNALRFLCWAGGWHASLRRGRAFNLGSADGAADRPNTNVFVRVIISISFLLRRDQSNADEGVQVQIAAQDLRRLRGIQAHRLETGRTTLLPALTFYFSRITSAYSAGTFIEPSVAILNSMMRARMSDSSADCPLESRARKALWTGP